MIKKIILTASFVIVSLFVISRVIVGIKAEQIGSSPESGVTSHIKAIYDSLVSLSHGSNAAGSWGDWGAMWNRIRSAGEWVPVDTAVEADVASGKTFHNLNRTQKTGTYLYTPKNGGNTDYPKSLGGVDDYNNGGAIPADSYQSTWTVCNAGNTYCGTGRSVAEKKDENTGLVWSPLISAGLNWFQANNCVNNGATCTAHGQAACRCTKLTSSKTGCEGYDDGNWRLPYQKELMISYIDGSWAQLTNAALYFWSSATGSYATQNSWVTGQLTGYTNDSVKSTSNAVRCVR